MHAAQCSSGGGGGEEKKEEKGEGRKHLDSLVKFAHLEQVLVSARAS